MAGIIVFEFCGHSHPYDPGTFTPAPRHQTPFGNSLKIPWSDSFKQLQLVWWFGMPLAHTCFSVLGPFLAANPLVMLSFSETSRLRGKLIASVYA